MCTFQNICLKLVSNHHNNLHTNTHSHIFPSITQRGSKMRFSPKVSIAYILHSNVHFLLYLLYFCTAIKWQYSKARTHRSVADYGRRDNLIERFDFPLNYIKVMKYFPGIPGTRRHWKNFTLILLNVHTFLFLSVHKSYYLQNIVGKSHETVLSTENREF